jgi:S1-C subfamily serine protease
VLTTYQPAKGAQNLSAEYLLSGATFKATVIGTDPAAGLALLQLAGRPGWPFVTVEVGNSDSLVHNAEISDFTSYHAPGQVLDTAVGTTGTTTKVTIDAGTLTAMNVTVDVANTSKTRSGLMASTLQSDMPSVLGGPLVDLNGKVIVADERAFHLSLGPPSPRSEQLIADLTAIAGPEFTDRVHSRRLPRAGPQAWCHPVAGGLLFDRELLELPAADAQQVIVLLAANDLTSAALSKLRRGGGLALVQ